LVKQQKGPFTYSAGYRLGVANCPGLLELKGFPGYKISGGGGGTKTKQPQENPRHTEKSCLLYSVHILGSLQFTMQLIFFKVHLQAIVLSVYVFQNATYENENHKPFYISQYPRLFFFCKKSKTAFMIQYSMEIFPHKNFCKLLFQNSSRVQDG